MLLFDHGSNFFVFGICWKIFCIGFKIQYFQKMRMFFNDVMFLDDFELEKLIMLINKLGGLPSRTLMLLMLIFRYITFELSAYNDFDLQNANRCSKNRL